MDRRETETLLSHHLHRCLHVIDRNKGDSVGAVEHKGHLAVMQTGLQVGVCRAEAIVQRSSGTARGIKVMAGLVTALIICGFLAISLGE